jgi:Putative serine esterase (DUF676)
MSTDQRVYPNDVVTTVSTTTNALALSIVVCLSLIISFSLMMSYHHIAKFHTPVRNDDSPVAIFSIDKVSMRPLLLHENNVVERVHVIILVHGWVGCPQDLAYVHKAMEDQARKILADDDSQSKKKHEPIYVYTSQSNHGRTHDGIQAGAERVAQESQDFLNNIIEQYEGSLKEITVSIVGYSLGGLYARYALPDIIPSEDNKRDTNMPRIVPKIFCTIATPHLGSRGHTYLQLPEPLERLISLQTQTWRDLFHHSEIIDTTIKDPRWVEPLLRFEKRIAYANTYGIDMMVPTSTAAFVTENSTSEHFQRLDHSTTTRSNEFMALIVETPPRHDLLREQQSQPSTWDHSQHLDAMGWTKVFVDFSESYHQDSTTARSFMSLELFAEFQRSKRTVFLPLGHGLIAVNSKTLLSSYAMRRGRPFIDQLAQDFIREILTQASPNDGTCLPS